LLRLFFVPRLKFKWVAGHFLSGSAEQASVAESAPQPARKGRSAAENAPQPARNGQPSLHDFDQGGI
jgi:hypothetical protein